MQITKVKYHGGNTEICYSVLKPNGDKDEYSLKSSDPPLPAFRNVLLYLRVFLLRMLEMPDTDEEIKKVTVRAVKFDYGEDGTMGAVISGIRELQYSRGVMALSSPHRFEESTDEKQLLEGKCIEHLNILLEEAEKYVNGERAQTEMKFDSPEEAVKDAVKASKKKKKELSKTTVGSLIVKSKGKNVKIAPGYANRLTQLVNIPDLLIPSKEHKDCFELGNGTALLFEKKGDVLDIVSATEDEKPIAGDELKKNVVEEIVLEIEKWAKEKV